MRLRLLVCAAVLSSFVQAGLGRGTAFLYQGQLAAGGLPVNGNYDLTFTLFNAGGQSGSTLTNSATAVTNGLFSVALDFGPDVFNGSNLWLQIAVRTNGGGNFTPLAPMQPILSVPYAIMANTASNLSGPLPATQISGGVDAVSLNGVAGSNYATLDMLTNYATVDSVSNAPATTAIANMQVFDSPGAFQFTVPSNVTQIAVEVWGGGGGGGNSSYSYHGAGGGGGGYGKGMFAVASGTNFAVIVGAGGGAAIAGGASSFGALISATGGSGGPSSQVSGLGGAGGTSAAPINVTGGAGQWTTSIGGSDGGNAGSGGSGGRGDAGSFAGSGQAPGGGGGGGELGDSGGSGAHGRVIVYY